MNTNKAHSEEKKKVTKKRKLVSKPATLMTLAKKIRSLEKSVEKKYYQFSSSAGTQVGSSGFIEHYMSLIIQGTGQAQRLGNQIKILYIQIEWRANITSTTLQGAGSLDIVLDRKPTGTLPTLLPLYSNANAGPYFLPNKDLVGGPDKRFKILSHTPFEYDLNTLSSLGYDDKAYLSITKYGKTQFT